VTDEKVDPRLRAEHHAKEAERLLAKRWDVITTVIKAGSHATLAVYYATLAGQETATRQRS